MILLSPSRCLKALKFRPYLCTAALLKARSPHGGGRYQIHTSITLSHRLRLRRVRPLRVKANVANHLAVRLQITAPPRRVSGLSLSDADRYSVTATLVSQTTPSSLSSVAVVAAAAARASCHSVLELRHQAPARSVLFVTSARGRTGGECRGRWATLSARSRLWFW